jgi:thiol-disulfide isomerase/thioredoxin
MLSIEAVILALAFSGAGETGLIDFSAEWCGPCRQMEPAVRQLAAQGFPVRKVNIDQDRELAARYGVTSIPCFVMVVDGREVDRAVGAVPMARLQQMLQAAGTGFPPTTALAQARGQSPESASAESNVAPRLSMPAMQSAAPLSETLQAGAAAPGMNDLRTPSGNAESAASPEIVSRVVAATVRLRIDDGGGNSVGSGTIIDSRSGEALIVTCGHVFRDSKGKGQILVDLFGANAPKGLPGHLVSYDLKTDLGLVSIKPGVPIVTAPLATREYKASSKNPVISVGCDHGADPSPRVSHVTTIGKFLGPPNLQVAGQPVQGRSGGGLFNTSGQLIGVCYAADPADDEGLYSALESIHSELTRLGLSDLILQDAAALASAPPPTMPASLPPVDPASPLGQHLSQAKDLVAAATSKLSPQEANLLDGLSRTTQGAEVICIVRSLANPNAKSEIIVLDKASPSFLQQLAADSQRQSARHLTSLAVPKTTSTASRQKWEPKWGSK